MMFNLPHLPRPAYNFKEQLKLLHEGKFSDFEIHIEQCVFRVHRAVVCAQSSFFKALAGGDFKEATDQKATIEDEDSALLARYLIYLYSDSYPESDVSRLHEGSQFKDLDDSYAVQDDPLKACDLHAQMYCFAKQRCDDRLERYALQEFSRNFFTKRPRQTSTKHNLEPKGATRTLKYHNNIYSTGNEESLLLGTNNTFAQVYELLLDFSDWSEITIVPKRIRTPDDPLYATDPHHRRARTRYAYWKDNNNPLADFDFENVHLIVTRSPNSHAKNLSLLSSLIRWSTKTMSQPEQDLIRTILSETPDHGPTLRDMLSVDLITRKHAGALIPDPTYRALQLEFPAFFLGLDSQVSTNERRQCQTCQSVQPVLRQACSCGRWSDACENEECLKRQMEELVCFCCLERGGMKKRVAGGGRHLPLAFQGMMYPYDYLFGDEFDF